MEKESFFIQMGDMFMGNLIKINYTDLLFRDTDNISYILNGRITDCMEMYLYSISSNLCGSMYYLSVA